MTTAVRTPDPTRCPDCRAVLTGTAACQACGLALQGPAAQRLWELDTELLRLDAERGELLVERGRLLARLRAGTAPAAATPSAAPPRTPAPEWTPKRVQNALLSLGGLLLAVAALVFTAVTYDRLGAGGRAVVLVALTAAAGLAVPYALRRGLGATAETLTAVALVLTALDAYGLRRLGLADGSGSLAYAAGSAAVVAACAAAYARVVPVRTAGAAAVLVAQLPVPLLLADAGASAPTSALALAGLAAADLVFLAALRGRVRRHVTTLLAASAATATGLGLLLAGTAPEGGRAAAAALLAHAAVLVGAGALAGDRAARTLLWAAPVPVLAGAAHLLAEPELTRVQQPLVLAAVGLLAVQAASLLPARLRTGPVLGGLAVSAAGVLAVAEPALSGLLLPLTWLLDPWTLPAGASAREAVGTSGAWDGSVVTTVVLAAAAVVTGAAGLALQRLREALVPAAALVAATAVLLPLGLALSYPAALAVLLLLAAGLMAAGVAVLPRPVGAALAGSGTAVALLAAAWSLADRAATLVVLAVTAALVAAPASRRLPAAATTGLTALAAALATAELVAAGAARGLAADQVGGLLLVAVAVLLGLAAVLDRVLDRDRSRAVEGVAVGAGLLAAGLAAGDPGWLSWVLAGTALLALATALRPGRRGAAVAGGLLLSASSWVRLADAGVTAPEPYVLPLAAVALVLSHLRARAVPGTRSWQAYGPGLSVLLLPSLLASLDDDSPTRPLLVGAAALAVLLLGARERLQAPLVLGGAVLAVDALRLAGPYAAALPRWSTIGLAGTLLVVLGATYERRLQEVARLRRTYDALG